MPFYEYQCEACGEKFSALLSISQRDEAEKTVPCPECGAVGPRRLMSSFAPCVSSSPGSSAPPPDCGGGG